MMTDKTDKLSALLDDELETEGLQAFVKQLTEDDEQRNKLARYALISETIKNKPSVTDVSLIADRVRAELENEPVVFAPRAQKKARSAGHWLKPAAGAAIAATVAMFAVSNLSRFNAGSGFSDEFPVTVDIARPVHYNQSLMRPASTQWTSANARSQEIEKDLNHLLRQHSEFSSQSGMQGMLPYTTIVVYDRKH